jgi:hypothetical protein
MSLNAYKIQSARFNLGLEDLMKAKTDPGMRLTATPFVDNAENTVFVGKSVPWKGNPSKMPPEVQQGLSRAISISKECAGVTGTVSVGGHRLPKKDVCEMERSNR